MTEEKVLYICNGDAPGCKKTACHLKGGDCRHTSDISNARSFAFDPMTGTYIEKEAGRPVRVILGEEPTFETIGL